jgi:hypothetical protein
VGSATRLAAVAYAVAITLIVVVAVGARLIGLSDQTGISDEGIRGIQLRLMAAGFQPVSEIYASQGPLSLWVFYPLTALFGPDILVARVTVVLSSLIALGGVFVLGHELDGWPAALAAALILALSPLFLENSRLAFVEVPSAMLTVLAIVLAARFRACGRWPWLVASALLLALGTLAKPMGAIAAPATAVLLLASDRPIGVAATFRRLWRRRLLDLLLYGGVGLAVCAIVIAAIGPAAVYDEVISYRLAARATRGWDFATNLGLVWGELDRNGPGLLVAAAIGLVATAARRRPIEIATVAWLLAGLVALLLYSPLWPKHVAYVMPPLALLAGGGVAAIWRALVDTRRATLRWSGAAGALLVAGLLLWSGPAIAADDRALIYRHPSSDLARYRDDVRIATAATRPGDFIVMDDAYPAMLTGRLTPPWLADLSWNRILARALTPDQAIELTRQYHSRVLGIQDDHLGQLNRYLSWADREYVLVKTYAQRRPVRFRRVYVSRDVDRRPILDALRASIATPTEVTLGPVDLLGYELERRELKGGSRVDLTLLWQARQDTPPEHALVVRLRAADGAAAQESEWKVGDGSQELHTWRAGDWQSQTLRLLVDNVSPGSYHLTLALTMPRGGAEPVTLHSGPVTVPPDGDEIDLGDVSVVR